MNIYIVNYLITKPLTFMKRYQKRIYHAFAT